MKRLLTLSASRSDSPGCELRRGQQRQLTGMSVAPSQSQSTTQPVTPAASGFTSAASMAQARGLHTATLMNDGRVLIVGGVDANSNNPNWISESEIYDPVANTFTKASDPSLGGSPGG